MRHHPDVHGIDGPGLAPGRTFEMALLTSVSGGAANLIGGPSTSLLGAIVPMHLLMGAFDAAAQRRPVAGLREDICRS
jgi:hypothetical protein